ncbi:MULTISPECIES: hypothetical protein [unclassified Mesorhizobium]|nr:hypothetical protein [Mesorhizobium sp. C089B]ESZ03135.1 hypothetical protein X736_26950 [Mesorhizobium sp. L2C089B000]WJI52150.1 hypothetical protein NLY44_05560 [Mesorhizobium sp. C089B]
MNDITPTNLAAVGTQELNYIGSSPDPFDITIISVEKGRSQGHVRLHKTLHNLHQAEFIGIEDPELGSFTDRNGLVRAIRDWSGRNGWKIEMAHVSSRTGERLDVNLAAL